MWKPWVWVAAEDRRSWSLVLCVWDQKICDCSNCATSILLQTRLSSRWYVSPDSTLMPVLLKFAGICWNWNSMLVQTWFNPDPICGLNSMENYASRKHAIPGNQERLLWVDNAGKSWKLHVLLSGHRTCSGKIEAIALYLWNKERSAGPQYPFSLWCVQFLLTLLI